jgi:Mrp family chromosome partitioning ATPase/uncharacterized protein involved in exopolysaccharide biosynthesis
VVRGRLWVAFGAFAITLAVAGTVSALWPRTYRAHARFVLDGGKRVEQPAELASRIEGLLLERATLEPLVERFQSRARTREEGLRRLRSSVSVVSEDALGFVVECRGTRPAELRDLTNRLAERAVVLLPQLSTAGAQEAAAAKELASRTRAVTTFLATHPEVTLDASAGSATDAGKDVALETLRSERAAIDIRLAELEKRSSDNPYLEPEEDPVSLRRRLAEVKTTIEAREAALKRRAAGQPSPEISPALQTEWRKLLAALTEAQVKAAQVESLPQLSGHITARAELPQKPIAPNAWLLALASLLLSLSAGMIGYVVPRRSRASRRSSSERPPASSRSPRPQVPTSGDGRPNNSGSDPPSRAGRHTPSASTPPLAQGGTVVMEGIATPSSDTRPGMSVAPAPPAAIPVNGAGISSNPPPPALLGGRPPRGAGTYSMTSTESEATRPPVVELLSPLPSAHPPGGSQRVASPLPAKAIVSRPPALDPEAEAWAKRFESPPPPPPEGRPDRRGSRWKTQMMGSMVPLDVVHARQAADETSAGASRIETDGSAEPAAGPPLAELTVQLVRTGWHWPRDITARPELYSARDAILQQLTVRRLVVAVSGASDPGSVKARTAIALSHALAEVATRRILLLEADFENPELHRLMNVEAPPSGGFSQQLMSRLQPGATRRPWHVVRCLPALHFLPEGLFRSPGVLLSREFESAVLELRQHYDVLVISGPPLTRETDLRALDTLADAGMIATREGIPPMLFDAQPLRKLVTDR